MATFFLFIIILCNILISDWMYNYNDACITMLTCRASKYSLHFAAILKSRGMIAKSSIFKWFRECIQSKNSQL